jgi:hypothetical protein
MMVSLLTDAPKHNLALMKISAWHKANGDQVSLNMINTNADLTYGSWLYSQKYYADINGGSVFPDIRLDSKFEDMQPDYSLYPIDYSLGYTWRYCPRKCLFCIVPKQNNLKEHKSIWSFHDARFKKICLLNNNTFSDPQWLETFQEIWDANLKVVDENGYDLRLFDDQKADALYKTKWDGSLHFAWDLMENESAIIRGLKLVKNHNVVVYVLVGFNTTLEEDLYRCQKIHDFGFDPYVMPYNRGTKENRRFKRFIDTRMYRKYETITEAWLNYGVEMPEAKYHKGRSIIE